MIKIIKRIIYINLIFKNSELLFYTISYINRNKIVVLKLTYKFYDVG